MVEALIHKYSENISEKNIDEQLGRLRSDLTFDKEKYTSDELLVVTDYLDKQTDRLIANLEEARQTSASEEELRKLRIMAARLLMAKLITIKERMSEKKLGSLLWVKFSKHYLELLRILAEGSPNYANTLLSIAVASFSRKNVVDNINFGWSTILEQKSYFSTDYLSQMICSSIELNSSSKDLGEYTVSCFKEQGSIIFKNGEVHIYPFDIGAEKPEDDEFPHSILLPSSRIYLHSDKDSQITTNDKVDVKKYYDFFKDFIVDQKENKLIGSDSGLRSYVLDDRLSVKVVAKDGELIHVESTDKVFNTIRGCLKIEKSYANLQYGNIYNSIEIGDILPNVKFLGAGEFSLALQLALSVEDTCKKRLAKGTLIPAVLLKRFRRSNGVSRYTWMTQYGIPANTREELEYNVGDVATLVVTNYNLTNETIYLNAEVFDSSYSYQDDEMIGLEEEPLDCDEVEWDEELLDWVSGLDFDEAAWLLMSKYKKQPYVRPSTRKTRVLNLIKFFDDRDIENLANIVLESVYDSESTDEKFCKLISSGALFNMLGIKSMTEYIKTLLRFLVEFSHFAAQEHVDGKIDISENSLDNISPRRISELEHLREILSLLNCFGMDDLLRDFSRFALCRVSGGRSENYNHKNSVEDYDSMLLDSSGVYYSELIEALLSSSMTEDNAKLYRQRYRISSLLGVQDKCQVSEARKTVGKYGKSENDALEFKSSYVFANDNGRPSIARQGRDEIFRSVCGMLNHHGGKVYLGVNDNGDPYRAPGTKLSAIENDIFWLNRNHNLINSGRYPILGHNIIKVNDLDSFCLFLQIEANLYLGEEVSSYISITPTEDLDAILFNVQPKMDGIAYLYKRNFSYLNAEEKQVRKVAYIRKGVSTFEMTKDDVKLRLSRLNREQYNSSKLMHSMSMNHVLEHDQYICVRLLLSGKAVTHMQMLQRDRHLSNLNYTFEEVEDNKWIFECPRISYRTIRSFIFNFAPFVEVLPSEDSEELLKEIRTYVKKYLSEI